MNKIEKFTNLTTREKALLKLSFENVFDYAMGRGLETIKLSTRERKALATIEEYVFYKTIQKIIDRDCETISKQREREVSQRIIMLGESVTKEDIKLSGERTKFKDR